LNGAGLRIVDENGVVHRVEDGPIIGFQRCWLLFFRLRTGVPLLVLRYVHLRTHFSTTHQEVKCGMIGHLDLFLALVAQERPSETPNGGPIRQLYLRKAPAWVFQEEFFGLEG
jgi:hypothetical protein